MDGSDDGRRGVEGVEGGTLGAVILLGGKQHLQFFAHFLPAGILVLTRDRVGEYRESNRAETGEAGKRLFFFGGGGLFFYFSQAWAQIAGARACISAAGTSWRSGKPPYDQ